MQAQRSCNTMSREQTKVQNTTITSYCLSAEEKLSVMEALDHIHVTRQYQEMGSCTVCKKISIKKCSGCGTFYCSSECQTFDWPKHRIICSKQRDSLSERNSIASSRKMRSVSSLKNFNDGILITDRGSPFTALANQLSKKSGIIVNESKSLANFKIGNKQYQNGNHLLKNCESGSNSVKESKKNPNDKRKHSPKKCLSKFSPDEKKRVGNKKNISKNGCLSPVNKQTKNIANGPINNNKTNSQEKESILAKVGAIEVFGTYRDSLDRCWVMTVEDLPKYQKIQAALSSGCPTYETIQPEVGIVCGCIFEKEWYRGKIVALTPEITVHFIDYGNYSTSDDDVFKKLPKDLEKLPGLAFRIEFDTGTPIQYRKSEIESIRMTIEETSRTYDGVPRVKVLEGPYGRGKDVPFLKKPERKNPAGIERSVMDTLTATCRGMMHFVTGFGNLRFAALVPNDDQDANDCIDTVFKMYDFEIAHNVKPGENVMIADGDGNLLRGIVVCKISTEYYVQLMDCGNVITTDTVYSFPEGYKEFIQIGVKVLVDDVFLEEKMQQMDSCCFTMDGEAFLGKWPCLLKTSRDQIIAKVSLVKPPKLVPFEVQYSPMKCGSTVEMSSKAALNTFYIRSVDGEIEQKLFEMNVELTQHSQDVDSFKYAPQPGELVSCKYHEDNCYYRAIVNSIFNHRINVLFVDFGNCQSSFIEDIKPLPDSLKEIPFFAYKVTLSNVLAKPWNNMIKEYVEKLISDNVELTLTYKDSIENGVVLKEKVSGVVVNDFIEKARDKILGAISESYDSWSPDRKEKEVFLDDDLKYTTVPSGSVCPLALLYVSEAEFESSYRFWATAADVENFDYVNGELSSMIGEYCDSISTPYEPSFRELCLAEYEGSWYRAICIENNNKLYKVFFVDFGNVCELKSSSIRKISEKFIKAPALAMNCTLAGRERLEGNPELAKKICEMLLKRMNTLIRDVVITKYTDDTFLLRIPEICDFLAG